MSRNLSRLPNLLTGLRLALAPLAGHTILGEHFQTALAVFALAAATDFADGFLARRFGWITRFGAVADPLADKLLLVTTYVSLGLVDRMPVWLVALVLSRDVLILAIAGLVMSFTSIRDFPPSRWGKLSTFLQVFAAVLALAAAAGFIAGAPLEAAFLAAAAGAIGSGFHYLAGAISRVRAARSGDRMAGG